MSQRPMEIKNQLKKSQPWKSLKILMSNNKIQKKMFKNKL